MRERAHRALLNPDIDAHREFKALEELQDLYADLDLQFQRYIVATASDPSKFGSAVAPRRHQGNLELGSQSARNVDEDEPDLSTFGTRLDVSSRFAHFEM